MLYIDNISILATIEAKTSGSFGGTTLSNRYYAEVPITRIRDFKALDENCEFFNDYNAIDNFSSAVTATISVTNTDTTIITFTIALMLATIEFDIITITTSNNINQTQTIIENSNITTIIIIIPEHKPDKHCNHNDSYYRKGGAEDEDKDEKNENEDCNDDGCGEGL
jgi:hypothetical protein